LGSRSETILLTGSGGFTGRPLVERLRRDGHRVIGLTRHPGEVGEISGDLCDADWVRRIVAEIKPSVVLHLAGITTTLHADIGEIYAVNVVGTANLLQALTELASRPRLVVLASSATVYAPAHDDAPIEEDAPLEPQSHYAASKRATEMMARLYQDRLPILIVRPFNYTGPGQGTAFLVPKIVDHFVRRTAEIELGNLDLYRDISDVERVIEAYARFVSVDIAPGVVNICSGQVVFLRNIISLLENISGHRIKVVQVPALMRRNEPRTVRGSAARLEHMVGPLPNADIGSTLRRMYEASRVADRGEHHAAGTRLGGAGAAS
jgi:nucleoside-diphosphate-sugar epimerase